MPKEKTRKRAGYVIELVGEDKDMLFELVERYKPLVGSLSNRAFVIRQLIRNAYDAKKIPPVRPEGE